MPKISNPQFIDVGGAASAGAPTSIPGMVQPIQPSESIPYKQQLTAVNVGGAVATEAGKAPVPTQSDYQAMETLRSKLNLAEKQLARVRNLYKAGPKGQEPYRIFQEYFPVQSTQLGKDITKFNTAGNQLYSFANSLTRTPGEGAQDMREFAQKLSAFRPSSDLTDAENEEQMRGIQNVIDEYKSLVKERIGERKSTPKIDAAKRQMQGVAPKPVVIRFDAQGNRIK